MKRKEKKKQLESSAPFSRKFLFEKSRPKAALVFFVHFYSDCRNVSLAHECTTFFLCVHDNERSRISDTSKPEFDDTPVDTVPNSLGVKPYLYEPKRKAVDAEQSQHSSPKQSPDASRMLNTE